MKITIIQIYSFILNHLNVAKGKLKNVEASCFYPKAVWSALIKFWNLIKLSSILCHININIQSLCFIATMLNKSNDEIFPS